MITNSPQLPLDAKDRPGTNIDIDAHQLGVTLPAADREDLRKLNTKAEVRTWTLLKAEEHERLALVYRSMHNTTVTLSNTFPAELLSLIFAFATAPDGSTPSDRMALRLLRICRCWREVALGCSEIWANALDTGTFHMGEIGEYEYFLFALKLSTPRQLGFHISSFPQHFLSTTLPQNASRISRMTIKITSEDVFEQLYYALKSGMPVLCDLACPV
ncbi:uncharacterized protein BXZ73DRAFT_54950, partial [Epithele typhae]|uniref:uncharacterized protein n=1 Tax=Epithele typhae TaxID=378194 RepID=UPI002007D0F7